MALIDVICAAGHVSEVYRSIHDWPQTPPCPECQAPTEQTLLPKAVRWTVDPVVVYQTPEGDCRFPGDPNGRSAKYYEKLGYQRLELRDAQDVRRFEKHMNQREYSQAMRRSEAMARMSEEQEKARRSELRNAMQGFSERGKALARAAMRQVDQKPREYAKSTGFHSEVYSFDRSNRAESRDPAGRRRRD